jgi:hypothetical protein
MWLGVDPGASCGIAVLTMEHVLTTWKMPETEHDISDVFASIRGLISFAMIELVHSLPKQGVKSTFAFGRNYGFLRGMLVGHKIPFEDVPPGKWQAALRVKAIKDEAKTDHKNRLKGLAQQLFPHHHMTHAIADASLIVEYVYRLRKGIISEIAS